MRYVDMPIAIKSRSAIKDQSNHLSEVEGVAQQTCDGPRADPTIIISAGVFFLKSNPWVRREVSFVFPCILINEGPGFL